MERMSGAAKQVSTLHTICAPAGLLAGLETSCSIMHFPFYIAFSPRRFETFLIAFLNDLLSVSLTVGPLIVTETAVHEDKHILCLLLFVF